MHASTVLNERELRLRAAQSLLEDDYEATTKLLFPPSGSSGKSFCIKIEFTSADPLFSTPAHKLNFTFEFKDYAPRAFKTLRALSGISEEDYLSSLAGDFNYIGKFTIFRFVV